MDVAVWMDAFGATYEWPQATKDNRKSRVLARIERWGINPPVGDTLRIFRYNPATREICDYVDSLQASRN